MQEVKAIHLPDDLWKKLCNIKATKIVPIKNVHDGVVVQYRENGVEYIIPYTGLTIGESIFDRMHSYNKSAWWLLKKSLILNAPEEE